jgi:uncharacterized protein YhfF
VSGFTAVKTDDTDSFFRAFKADAKVDADDYTVVNFGDSETMSDELLKLVLSGIKRATASLVRDFHARGEPIPKVGDYAVVVDGRNKPRCVYRVSDITIAPFVSVDDAFAFDEGEGDQTRAGWLREHRAYFERQAAGEGFVMHDEIETVFERFTVVWPRLFADDWTGPKLQ